MNIGVAIAAILGVVLGVGREIYLISSFGIGRELDIFKLSYSLPVFFSFTLGPALAAWFVGYAKNNDGTSSKTLDSNVFYISLLIAILIILFLALISSPLQLLLAPGLSAKESESFIYSFYGCLALVLLIPTLILSRVKGMIGYKASFASYCLPSFQLIWLCGLFAFHMLYGLSVSTVVIALILGVFITGIIFFGVFGQNVDFKIPKVSGEVLRYILIAFMGILLMRLLNVIPRFIDRAVASYEVGLASVIDLGFAMINAVATVVITYFTYVVSKKWVSSIDRSFKILLLWVVALGLVFSLVATILMELQTTSELLVQFGIYPYKNVLLIMLFTLPFLIAFLMSSIVLTYLNRIKQLLCVVSIKLFLKSLILGTLLLFGEFDLSITIALSFLLTEITGLLTVLFFVRNSC